MLEIRGITILVLSILLLTPCINVPLMPTVAYAETPIIITSLPYDITEPGIYILATDLSTDSYGINITVGNVTIIGNGHAIIGPGIDVFTAAINFTSVEGNITIKDLKIMGFMYGIYSYDVWSPGDHSAFADVILENLTIKDVYEGIYLEDYDYGGVIINNVFINNATDYGIYLYDVNGPIIKNVFINGSGIDDYGIYMDNLYGAYLYNVTIKYTYYEGIYMNDCEYVAIVNSFIGYAQDYGITIDYSAYILLLFNDIVYNSYTGVYSYDSSDLSIVSNNISYNEEDGVYIEDSYDVFIKYNYIYNNSYDGIFLDDYTYDVNITGNQILRNGYYGVEVLSNDKYVNITLNVFWYNNIGGEYQAYDDDSIGNWYNNYWSDLSDSTYYFDYNSDPSPLSDPLYDLDILDISLPSDSVSGIVPVRVTVRNPTIADALNVLLNIYWSEPPEFTEIEYMWIDIDDSTATSISIGDIVEDYGNYTLVDEDDGYFVYKLPWPINIFGRNYTYIGVSTNGYIEFLSTTTSVLYGGYSVHVYGSHRYGYGYEYTETYGAGVTTLFAYSGDLWAINYVGAFNLNDKIVIVFNGSTYEDEDPDYPVQYEIILYENGTIIVSLGDILFTYLYGDGFTGLYYQPLGLEIPAGYMLPSHTSYRIDPALHPAASTTISVNANQTKTFTLYWDTSLLPHYSPYAIWSDVESTSDESNYVNNLEGPAIVEVRPGGVVGGELISISNVMNATDYTIISFFTILLAGILISSLLYWRKHR